MPGISFTDRGSLWSLILGPNVCALHLLAVHVSAMVPCAKGWNVDVAGFGAVRIAIGAATLVAVAANLRAGPVAWRRWGEDDVDTGFIVAQDRDTVESRRRFTVFSAVLLAGLTLTAVLYQAMPAVFVAPCRRTARATFRSGSVWRCCSPPGRPAPRPRRAQFHSAHGAPPGRGRPRRTSAGGRPAGGRGVAGRTHAPELRGPDAAAGRRRHGDVGGLGMTRARPLRPRAHGCGWPHGRASSPSACCSGYWRRASHVPASPAPGPVSWRCCPQACTWGRRAASLQGVVPPSRRLQGAVHRRPRRRRARPAGPGRGRRRASPGLAMRPASRLAHIEPCPWSRSTTSSWTRSSASP